MLREDPDYATRAAKVSALAKDISEFLDAADLPPGNGRGLSIAYHAACSIQHGQKVTEAPRRVLARAGYEVKIPAEAHLCCGSAGTYNILQPEIAASSAIARPPTSSGCGPTSSQRAISAARCRSGYGQDPDRPYRRTGRLGDRRPRAEGAGPIGLVDGSAAQAIGARCLALVHLGQHLVDQFRFAVMGRLGRKALALAATGQMPGPESNTSIIRCLDTEIGTQQNPSDALLCEGQITMGTPKPQCCDATIPWRKRP